MGQSALAVVPQQDIQVSSMEELRDLAKDAADSRFFGAATPEQAICLMLAGKDLGFSYMQSLRLFHVVSGKPTLSADALVAIVKAHPSCEKFHRVSESNTEATWTAKRRGEPEQTSTFTMEDARAAGLLEKKAGNNWQTYPKRMLNARAKAFLARDVWPDLVAGLYASEEMSGESRYVESEVRHVPEPRPTPVPSSGPRTTSTDLDRHINALIAQLDGATDTTSFALAEAELKATMPHLKDHPRRPEVGHAYQAAKKRTATVIVEKAPEPAPMREPGEEG